MPKLTLVLGRNPLKVYDLDQPVIKIGRVKEMDIVIDNPSVSRNQAELVRQTNGTWIVRDLGSSNGTFVNGDKLSGDRPLQVGDEISMGDISVVFFDAASQEGVPTVFRPMPADCPIRCDSSSWEVWVGDRHVDSRLSVQEFELLSLLTSRYGRVCTRDELGTAIWGKGNYTYNMLHRVVHRLKQKLSSVPEWVASVPGVGYKIERPSA